MVNNLYKKLKIAVLHHINPLRAPARYYKNVVERSLIFETKNDFSKVVQR
jgi:hypothetical protein